MRKLTVLAWLLLPIMVAAYHYGPGQDQLRLDRAAGLLAVAEKHAAAEEWAEAEADYEAALEEIPSENIGSRQRVRLELAKVQMFVKKLPDAHRALQSLVTTLQSDQDADPALYAEARSALANAQYYMTWLMRLEGRSKDRWQPEAESARQIYKRLAQEADAAGDTAAAVKHREDLESVIRMERMELSDLQGLPLPSQ